MLFNSFEFLIFFPTVAFLYYSSLPRYRWIILLIASYYFYASWNPNYLFLIFFVTILNYFAGIYISTTISMFARRSCLVISLVMCFGMLFFFKYYGFFSTNINNMVSFVGLPLEMPYYDILLPIGISFFTFQAASYTIDVYCKRQSAEKNLGIFSLYIVFFPQLVAGPIERASNLLTQMHSPKEFNYHRVVGGLRLMVLGIFKKVVIADGLAQLVNHVYNNPHSHNGLSLIIATIFFAFQIYYDFSGYTSIAIGAAQVLGFNLSDNFNRPYFATSISDFWRRWHITLTSWFRDYIYIPLGGNSGSNAKTNINLFLTFLFSGLWHGANWTFVIWGGINGIYLIFERVTSGARKKIKTHLKLFKFPKIYNVISIAITFTCICFAWIFFRANTINDAVYIIKNIFIGWDTFDLNTLYRIGLNKTEFYLVILFIFFLEYFQSCQKNETIRSMFSNKSIWFRWAATYLMLLAIYLFGNFGKQEFIYFQF